ncbi:phage holin family protein [Deinococcus sp. Marseille-Q6407]|uniref:phage holin family protein n=1 Tax=Deinococcus sp. Marseille-Q6407 TaxID=2969223 RepID=UPI0021C15274|nr:phage holin family protein [Deinococcus sp. Marseille-Q6407]
MGSAIVDVFDAGVALVKAEINSFAHTLGELAKSKGLGLIMLLSALVPLTLALIFLILAVYFGLVALGLPWWAAALVMFLGSLLVAAVMVALGINKLSEGIGQENRSLTEDERLEAEYLAEQRRRRTEGAAPVSGAVVATGVPVTVGTQQRPVAHYEQGGQVQTSAFQPSETQYGQSHTTVVSGGPSVQRVSDAGLREPGEPSGMVQPDVEGAYPVPVYEPGAEGRAEYYGQGLNEKLDPQTHGSHQPEHDPNVVHPEVLEGAPEVRVSTQPTYAEDMSRADQGERK